MGGDFPAESAQGKLVVHTGQCYLFVVLVQIFTGILLTIYYVPTPDHAYDSILYISTQVPAGWLIRGLHHWGASAMVILTVMHMIRVILYGLINSRGGNLAYWCGIAPHRAWLWLYRVSLAVGPKGLLGYDCGYTNRRCHTFYRDPILLIMRGGEDLTAITLARFFGMHVWILPTLLLLLVSTHLYLVIRIGISSVPSREI
jgi:quinol-cytochrome oxidoreductase complex cytochrome b subunit